MGMKLGGLVTFINKVEEIEAFTTLDADTRKDLLKFPLKEVWIRFFL